MVMLLFLMLVALCICRFTPKRSVQNMHAHHDQLTTRNSVPIAYTVCVVLQVGLGDYNINPNYFEQNQAEALDPQLTVLDTLIRAAPDAKLNDLKQLLGRMLFSGSAMEKKVRSCWGCDPWLVWE